MTSEKRLRIGNQVNVIPYERGGVIISTNLDPSKYFWNVEFSSGSVRDFKGEELERIAESPPTKLEEEEDNKENFWVVVEAEKHNSSTILFASREEAEQMAERFAKERPGTKFYVAEIKSCYQSSMVKTTY